MKKLLLLSILLFSACTPSKVEVVPPTYQELGKICTYITSFDQDFYNVSVYYDQNDEYPIQNEKELYEISDTIIKYSSSGLKDVSKYEVNPEEALSACAMSRNANVIKSAIQIDKEDFDSFIEELKNYPFQYQVNREEKTFRVAMPNEVIVNIK